MKKVMFAALSLLSLVVLIACGEEETKRLKLHNNPQNNSNKRLYNKLLLEKMRQTSPYNLWMVKKLSYLIIRGKKST